MSLPCRRARRSTISNTAAHGTCVAGEVGAATNNGTGVASVGYDNTVTVYKVHGIWVDGDTDLGIAPGSAVIFTDAVTNAMYGAVDDGADVISMSLGSSSSSIRSVVPGSGRLRQRARCPRRRGYGQRG